MNTIAYFEIQASEPEKLVAFYKAVFGWEFAKEEFQPIEYWRMTDTSGVFGAILKRPVAVSSIGGGTNAFTCSIEVENFDATARNILSLGGIVAMAKFAVPGRCWQGYFLDPDHNVFGVFQADESAR
jgi:uncharacterized protein